MCFDDQDIRFIHNGNFTIAFGEFYDSDFGPITFAGAAKRHPKDEVDEIRGENIALAKAYINLDEQLLALETSLIGLEQLGG